MVPLVPSVNLGWCPLAVTHGLRIWQPFTYLFLHDGILHILFNLLFLWMFGADLERAWGTRRFYEYYFLTGVGAGCTTVIVKTLLAHFGMNVSLTTSTIGASGAIYGVLLWLCGDWHVSRTARCG